MTKIILIFPKMDRGRLFCKWIETGNPVQPLGCIWINRDENTIDRDEAEAEPAHCRQLCA